MSSWWPLIRLLPVKTNFRFVPFALFAASFSILLVLASFASFATGGFARNPIEIYQSSGADKVQAFACSAFNCGVDFKGGSVIEVETPGPAPIAELRASMAAMDLGDVQVQQFGTVSQALIRFETPEGVEPAGVVGTLKERLVKDFPGIKIARAEVVGPKVSAELFRSGVMALGLAIFLMLIYIWFRFEMSYAIGAVMALFHDLILTLGLLSVLRIEFTLVSIAALLTIIGYSMNDTVVVYDRMRENRRKYKKMSWADLIDQSLNETFSRTVITGGTALLALGGLMFIGGPTMFAFAFAMIFGIICGTYSSLYVAAPALLIFGAKVGGGAQQGSSAPAAAAP
jgi:preprotein translocase SecF subunit